MESNSLTPNSKIEYQFQQNCIPPQALSSEQILLVDLSRLILDPSRLKAVNSILERTSLDWDSLLEDIKRNALSGIVFNHLSVHDLNFPSQVSIEIEQNALYDQALSEKFYPELKMMSEVFDKIDVPVVLLKGAALAEGIYKSTLLRRWKDTDLLVYSEHVVAVEEGLRDLGYDYRKKEANGEYRLLTEFEKSAPRIGSLHRPKLTKFDDNFPFRGPSIDLHYSSLRLGKYDYRKIIEQSKIMYKLGSGLKVPALNDLVIHSAFHLYRHYRIKRMDSADRISPGILKYLMDIYSCLCVYFEEKGTWFELIERSQEIQAREILTYGLYYLNLVYGQGTVPQDIINALLRRPEFQIPVSGNSIIKVNSSAELLKPEICFSSGSIDTLTWMFNPQNTLHTFKTELEQWKATGHTGMIAECSFIDDDHSGRITNLKCRDWDTEQTINISEDSVNINQFFCSHIADFAKPCDFDMTAKVRLLWNHSNLFANFSVSANEQYYVPEEFLYIGESLIIYIKHPLDDRIFRIGVALGKTKQSATLSLMSAIDPSKVDTLMTDLKRHQIDLQMFVQQTNTDYQLELHIPWQILNIEPYAGMSLEFDTEVRLLSETLAHKMALTWSGGPITNGVYPEFFGTINLVDRQ